MEPYEIIGRFELLKHKVQKKIVNENQSKRLQDLDVAMLLSVILGNWGRLKAIGNFNQENKDQFYRMRTARNRWSHLSTDDKIQRYKKWI